MSTEAQRKDFARRTGGSPAPAVPIKELPKASDTLAVFAHTPERRAALKKQDEENEEWRKSLSFSVGTAAAAPAATSTTVTNTVTTPPPAPAPAPLPAPLGVLCPDNGRRYEFVPRQVAGVSGPAIVGQWVEV